MLRLLTFIAISSASIASAADDTQSFELAGANAVAYNAQGAPLFIADQAFLLDYLGTQGQIFEVKVNKVRVSADGADEVWLRCSELKPLEGCAQQTSIRGSGGTRAAGIPNCPGDPRCPRKGSK